MGKKPIKTRAVGQNTKSGPLKPAQKPRRRKRAYSANPDSQYFTREEITAFFNAIDDVRNRSIFRLVYHRGLRSSEVGMLKMSDWRERSGMLYVRRGKGSLEREYRLLPEEVKPLRAWLRIRGHDPGALFRSRQFRAGSLGISRSSMDRLVRFYGERAGIRPEKCHMHALRHSCATHLAERNNDAQIIQDWLGHKSAASTQIYMHFSQRRRDEAYERNKDWR
jgi:integrase